MTSFLIVLGVLVVLVAIVVATMINRQKREEAWQKFAAEVGGQFVAGGMFGSGKVQLTIHGRSAVLDLFTISSGDSSTSYTRIRAPYQQPDGLQFTLARTTLVSKLDNALGAKKIEIGDAEFDQVFTVRGNKEAKIRAAFTNASLRQLLQQQRSTTLRLKDHELILETEGVIRDSERLKSLMGIFKQVLIALEV